MHFVNWNLDSRSLLGAEFEFVDQLHLSTDINIENSNFQNCQPTNAPKVPHNLNFLTTTDKIDKTTKFLGENHAEK